MQYYHKNNFCCWFLLRARFVDASIFIYVTSYCYNTWHLLLVSWLLYIGSCCTSFWAFSTNVDKMSFVMYLIGNFQCVAKMSIPTKLYLEWKKIGTIPKYKVMSSTLGSSFLVHNLYWFAWNARWIWIEVNYINK